MNISIDNDFLADDYFKSLAEEFQLHTTPYYICDGVSHKKDGHLQFTHTICANGEIASPDYFELLKLHFNKLQVDSIISCKVNLIPKTETLIEHGWHIDVNQITEEQKDYVKTSVLYLNSTNGYTIFRGGIKVPSRANRHLMFPNHYEHASTTNTCDAIYRLALVTNYMISK